MTRESAPKGASAAAADDPSTNLQTAAARRVVSAIEELHAAARAFGMDPVEAYAPFAIRTDAWCYRVDREREAWAVVFGSQLFAPRDTLWPVPAKGAA